MKKRTCYQTLCLAKKTWILSEQFSLRIESTAYKRTREKRPMFSLITNFATFHCYCKKNISSLETRLNPGCTMWLQLLGHIFNIASLIIITPSYTKKYLSLQWTLPCISFYETIIVMFAAHLSIHKLTDNILMELL